MEYIKFDIWRGLLDGDDILIEIPKRKKLQCDDIHTDHSDENQKNEDEEFLGEFHEIRGLAASKIE